MPTYICTKCGCIDNTACGGNYWGVIGKANHYKDDFANKNVLCVECTPKEYDDGSTNKKSGKWHNKFQKEHWSKYGTKDELIKECRMDRGNVVNAIEYFERIENTN